MSLSEKHVIERIAEVDFGERPPAGWQAAVHKQIRDEDQPSHLRLVGLLPAEPERERPGFSLALSGFALAAAVILAFVFVQDQRRDNRITERTTAIAMVVEFVELESEMAQALAEIDSTQARMDEAFRVLRFAQEGRAARFDPPVVHELPPNTNVPRSPSRLHEKRARSLKAKSKAKSNKAKSRDGDDSDDEPLVGL